ncbi:MAG: Alanine racemase 1 [Dehalococcoidia bacterium]|nr:Alanine racemase 1 [Bacillota bacterium]
MRPMAEVRIDLDQLAGNIRLVRQNLPQGVKILFAVKRDAYGHGLIELSQRARDEGVEWLGVADLLEVEKLRRAGVELPVLIMGLSRAEDVAVAIELRASLSIASLDFAARLDQEAKAQGVPASVQVEIDTGLGRFGVFPDEALEFFVELQKFSNLQVEGIFSHPAVADSQDADDRVYTLGQIEKLNRVLAQLDEAGMLPPLRHFACAPCLINYPEETLRGYYNMVRIGAVLYGYPEAPAAGTWAEQITPIATVTTRIIALRQLPAGSYISYNRTYRTDSVRQIAVIPLGFGSGLHRALSNRGEVVIGDKRAPIVGRICMDHTMIDVTGLDAKIGDEVEVVGPRLTAEEQAAKAGVGANDILTPLCRQVQRVYRFTPSRLACSA